MNPSLAVLGLRLLFLMAAVGARWPENQALASGPTAVSLTLAWDAVPGSDVAGYNLYYGASSGAYTNVLSVTSTQATVPDLVPGTLYFFAVTTLGTTGLESLFSAEISTVVGSAPPAVQLSIDLSSSTQPRITGAAPPGYQYEVLATSDLRAWTTIGTAMADSSGLIQFDDPDPPSNSCRLYQLRQVAP